MWADLASQSIDGALGSYNAGIGVLQSGRGRAIAVSRKRMTKLPEVATFREQGATSKVFELTGFQCAVVPARTPDSIIKRYAELLVAAGKSDKVQEVLSMYGLDEIALDYDSTQELYRRETPIWLELVKTLGLAPT
jgi:tripartite-type tricarboxylate transporter receptor subunit TctC